MASLQQQTLRLAASASRKLLVTASASVFLAACACAQERPGMPPAEAFTACKALSAGQNCSFTTPRGTDSGSCWAPEGKPLACRPKNAPAPGADGKKP